jgi:putative hydrolase of the HAD superfamily
MKTILFDYFNVISAPVYEKVIKKFLGADEYGPWMKKLDDLDVGAISEDQLVRELAIAAKVSEGTILMELQNSYDINHELINYIRDNLKGKYKIGLLTNIARSLIEKMIPEELKMFDVPIISSDLKLIKPDPRIFEAAIKLCECNANEILFIDDKEVNIEAAKQAGMNGMVYTTFGVFKNELEKYLVE